MGLTSSSTGKQLLIDDSSSLENRCDFTIALAGNPNVGKSTIFNALTGLHQHTGNWPGKTVANASGTFSYNSKNFLLVDIPGTYSLMSNSEEEEIARDYICFCRPDITVVIVDATCLERNLNFVYQTMEITDKIIICVNLLDEAEKKKIHIDLDKLSDLLGIPVVGTSARTPETLDNFKKILYNACLNPSIFSPKSVKYIPIIEDCIKILSPEISSMIPNYPYLNRWICLKLMDEERNILTSIQNNFNINFSNISSLQEKLSEVKNLFIKNDITTNNFKDKIVSSIVHTAEDVSRKVCTFEKADYNARDRKIDKILTSKRFGIPIMILFLGLIFWITITGANYPSSLLSSFFALIQSKLLYWFDFFNAPSWLTGILIHGMYQTTTWVISVMLPPMAIFFPLFTLLEDLGYLPRIAFNLDNYFKKACSTGKQALTMCMGFGCNAAGVVGCRIIDSPRERLLAMLTNSFVPCNGRFPLLICIASIFIGSYFTGFVSSIVSTIAVLLVILLGIFLTLAISKLLSKTILKGVPSSYILELPPYRRPQIGKIIVHSLLDRTLFVLLRAISVAAPVGIVIWLFANVSFNDITILTYIANFLNPFAKLMGLDGYILTAFILGLPANEIVLPIILMSYLSIGKLIDLDDYHSIHQILVQNGWTLLTGINVMIFTLLHFPCGTTLLTIKKESGKLKWTILSFLLPTVCGILICFATTAIWNIGSWLL